MILLDIIEEFPDKNYYVLILGAGSAPLSRVNTSYEEVKNWGQLRWFHDIITDVQRSMNNQQLYTLKIAKLLSALERLSTII
ncbi:hypothetical protein ACJJIP_06795 [Microbulbifer sp. VTAC004]|uniref:hypothetical protein n=1 Tax=Microbulbifer sp. VTAC004 TaxID=3243386 RepID=UPI004039EB05